MDQDMQSLELAELYSSLPKGVDSSHYSEDTSFVNGELRIVKTDSDMLDDTDAGNALIGSILRDNKAELVSQTKRFLRNSPNRLNNSEEDQNTEILDRSVVAKLLRLCCMFDSVECASALIGGEVDGIVPRLNEVDESGRSQLHTAAEVHATRCIELLLRKRARTDLKSKDKQSQLALELSLSSRRMDVVWTVDDPIEDLLICLNQKDLTAVRLLSEKTKEIAEVAYKSAMDGKAVSLAALLMVAAKKFTTSIVADLSSKGKNYKASIARGKCFACSQRKILWANFPCQHLLWCDECKVHAARAAGTLEHKCVICDARVLDLVPRNVEQVCYEVSRNKEYPPYDPNKIRSLSEKTRSPLLSY